ncbi:MAG: GvpL/GvpF family gas vesicle protein [Proteobacteria bacterium]|nr:GvpL/GvpF family gas vesicle protein [Pseudomonadota bacterium]
MNHMSSHVSEHGTGFRSGHVSGRVSESADGLKLYCFARPEAVALFRNEQITTAIHSIGYRDVISIAERVSLREWVGPESEAKLNDLSWVGPRAVRHDQIIRAVMEFSPVFPADFGALFSSPSALGRYVRDHFDEISTFLDFVADKEEWALKGLLDRQAVQSALASSDERMARLPASSGARYLLEKKIHRDAHKKVGSFVAGKRAQLVDALAGVARDHKVLRGQSRAAGGRDKDVAINVAFLLAGSDRGEFLRCVDALAPSLKACGIELESVGPLPPYRFRPDWGEDGHE